MQLVSQGNPRVLSAMGLDGAAVGCSVTPEGIASLAAQVTQARDCGLRCDAAGADWNLIEKTIDDPGLMSEVMALLDEMAKLGMSDLMISCGLKKLDTLSEADRRTYETRYVEHLGQMYERGQGLGLHVCLHTSVAPGIYLDSVSAVDRWLREFAMEANSLLLCVGCTESAGLDTLAMIDRWLPRIRIVHVRNVVGRYADGSAKDVRLDSGALDLPQVFRKLASVGFQGTVMPEHFPEFPCDNGRTVSQAFSLGYCRALIQAVRD